jgi:hypothetical protein
MSNQIVTQCCLGHGLLVNRITCRRSAIQFDTKALCGLRARSVNSIPVAKSPSHRERGIRSGISSGITEYPSDSASILCQNCLPLGRFDSGTSSCHPHAAALGAAVKPMAPPGRRGTRNREAGDAAERRPRAVRAANTFFMLNSHNSNGPRYTRCFL